MEQAQDTHCFRTRNKRTRFLYGRIFNKTKKLTWDGYVTQPQQAEREVCRLQKKTPQYCVGTEVQAKIQTMRPAGALTYELLKLLLSTVTACC
jgi:hypothetical protein